MSKEKYENKKLKKYFEKYVKKLPIERKYKLMITDILLRRADTFDLSPEEIRQDVISLMYNLKEISVEDMPEGYERASGLYVPSQKKIIISEKVAGVESDEKIYGIFAHELYHSLARDEEGRDRMGGYNTITGKYNASLLEAIVEKSSYRTIYGNDKQNNIYYNNSAYGYANITFIVDLLEATYGVSEKEFLKNGIMGREKLASFLAEKSGETPDSAYLFLDSIETNYALLHRSLYPKKGEELSQYEMSVNLESALTGIYSLCEDKMAERIVRSKPESFEEVSDFNDELKYDHNKLSQIMSDKLGYFSRYYDHNLRSNVYNNVRENRRNTLNIINDIDSLVEIAPNFSDEKNFMNAYKWASSGNLGNLPEETKSYYGIKQKQEYMFPMTQDIVDRAFLEEPLGPQYDNSKTLAEIEKKNNNFIKNGIDRVKNFLFRRNRKLLIGGVKRPPELELAEIELAQMHSEVEIPTIFPELTKEEQEKYNNQVSQAVNKTQAKSQEQIYRNVEDVEK